MAEFFAEAYARERYHSMKATALRGLAQFANEQEIADQLIKLRASLQKVEQSTPLNFSEYEMLLAPQSLPYVVQRYGYVSLNETLDQVNAQYERMPDPVKGLVTADESGNFIVLVSREEYRLRVAQAVEEVRARGADRADNALRYED